MITRTRTDLWLIAPLDNCMHSNIVVVVEDNHCLLIIVLKAGSDLMSSFGSTHTKRKASLFTMWDLPRMWRLKLKFR